LVQILDLFKYQLIGKANVIYAIQNFNVIVETMSTTTKKQLGKAKRKEKKREKNNRPNPKWTANAIHKDCNAISLIGECHWLSLLLLS
jgi:hypothetical protein